MKRLILVVAASLLMYAGTSAPAATRPPYDPFAMQRAAQAQGSAENAAFNRRQAIVTRLKNKTRPPSRPGNRSPHVPGEPYHDKDGDGVEDHGGHGPNNNPGNPPPFTPPGGGTGTNPGGNTTGDGNAGPRNSDVKGK